MCPHGGIPKEYYLDHGGEYAALADAMARLSVLAEMEFRVTLAKPYSPTSKGLIEGFFNNLEGIFKGLPGWIGGDRTNKKSVNKGQVVAPYSKGLAALEEDILAAVAIYNDRPQSGRLGGLSPLEMLEKKVTETGFEARRPTGEAFDLIFSRQDVRTIQNGGAITIGGEPFYGPCLETLLPGDKVDILIPLRSDRRRVFVRQGGRDLGWAELMPVFEHGDRAGARYQGELEAARGRAVAKLAEDVDPTISTFDIQKAAVRRTVPNAPEPAVWTRAIDKTATKLPAELEAEEDARRRAAIEDFLAQSGGTRRGINGGNR